jgi:hypothetical protein
VPTAKIRASTILSELEQAQSELVGKAVVLTDGKAGTVEAISLDEMHGLRISIAGPWEMADLNHQISAARMICRRSSLCWLKRVLKRV